jgi:hypothetical protein
MGTDVAGEILGVDDQGRTTYVLKELASDKSAIATGAHPYLFPRTTINNHLHYYSITATVVEAADHVSFAVNGRTPDFTGAVGFNCALDTKNQNALCLNPAGATATRALSRLFKVTVTGAAPVSTKEGAAAPRMRAGWTVWGVLLAGAYYQLA